MRLLVSFLIVTLLTAGRSTGSSIVWQKTLPGKSDARGFYLDFYADWCEACDRMEQELFRHREFSALIAKYQLVPVRIDLSQETPDKVKLAEKYHVIGLPTTVITDGKKKEVATIIGYGSRKEFLEELAFHLRSIWPG